MLRGKTGYSMDGWWTESCEDRQVIVWTVGGDNVARIDGL